MIALTRLSAQGYLVFMPRFLKETVGGPRVTSLFPSYIFANFDPDADRWLPILSTIGVKSLIMEMELRPRPVPEGIVEALIFHGMTKTAVPEPVIYTKGQQVVIKDGPLAGHQGRIVANTLPYQQRTDLLVRLMNGEVRVQVFCESLGLEAAPDRASPKSEARNRPSREHAAA